MTLKEFLKANRNNPRLDSLVDQAEREREIDEEEMYESHLSETRKEK